MYIARQLVTYFPWKAINHVHTISPLESTHSEHYLVHTVFHLLKINFNIIHQLEQIFHIQFRGRILSWSLRTNIGHLAWLFTIFLSVKWNAWITPQNPKVSHSILTNKLYITYLGILPSIFCVTHSVVKYTICKWKELLYVVSFLMTSRLSICFLCLSTKRVSQTANTKSCCM